MACVLYQAVTEGSGESPRLGCDGDLYTGTQEAGVSSTLCVLLSLHPGVRRRQARWPLGTVAHAELVSWVIGKPSDYLRINVGGKMGMIEV